MTSTSRCFILFNTVNRYTDEICLFAASIPKIPRTGTLIRRRRKCIYYTCAECYCIFSPRDSPSNITRLAFTINRSASRYYFNRRIRVRVYPFVLRIIFVAVFVVVVVVAVVVIVLSL